MYIEFVDEKPRVPVITTTSRENKFKMITNYFKNHHFFHSAECDELLFLSIIFLYLRTFFIKIWGSGGKNCEIAFNLFGDSAPPLIYEEKTFLFLHKICQRIEESIYSSVLFGFLLLFCVSFQCDDFTLFELFFEVFLIPFLHFPFGFL